MKGKRHAYLGVELELDDRPDLCFDIFREELEGAVGVADCNDLNDSFAVWAGWGRTFLSDGEVGVW